MNAVADPGVSPTRTILARLHTGTRSNETAPRTASESKTW